MIEKTNSTPSIAFDALTGKLQIKGESFPENVAKFYSPVLDWIKSYLEEETKEIQIDFKITYFNSSTSKVFMTLFDLLDLYAMKGREITVNWICDEDNDIAIECGEEFKEDLSYLSFQIEVC
jgi:hypothetical protein